jgi:hypothetical protein
MRFRARRVCPGFAAYSESYPEMGDSVAAFHNASRMFSWDIGLLGCRRECVFRENATSRRASRATQVGKR